MPKTWRTKEKHKYNVLSDTQVMNEEVSRNASLMDERIRDSHENSINRNNNHKTVIMITHRNTTYHLETSKDVTHGCL